MPNHSFGDLVNFYLSSTAMLLREIRIPQGPVEYLCTLLVNGRDDLVSQAFGQEGPGELRVADNQPTLADLLIRLARVMSSLQGDSVQSRELEEAARIASQLGELCEKFRANSTGYNYYEISYHFYNILGRPALAVAEKLRALSNPENVDQFHSAIWRLAIERVRHSCANNGEWLRALDAFELALSCPVETAQLQRQLCDSLEQQLKAARDTPINDLIAIYYIQAPACGIAEEKRRTAIRLLCEHQSHGVVPEAIRPEMEITAIAIGQVMFDDMRQRLQPLESTHPYIEWSNIAVRHDRLSGAVPLGESLIADIERTKWLLPDLIHEIGHGVALLGGIGINQSAFRAVTHFLEAYLIGLNGERASKEGLRAVPSLPAHSSAPAIALTQLRAAANAMIAQSVWTPWLEGVSMYYELVCDPRDDPTEISAIHECLRLLIDFDIPRREGEPGQEYVIRRVNEVSTRFETFVSKALRDTSRLNTLNYFDAPQRGECDTYILGYLVVRSVVAAWEKTLEYRLVPMRAAVLLLNATQAGTFDVFPALDLAPQDFQTDCHSHMTTWLANLAALPKQAIEEFLKPACSDEPGVPALWEKMIPRKVPHEEFVRVLEARNREVLEPMVLRTGGVNPHATDENEKANGKTLLALFNEFVFRNRLLPIGSDQARMFFMQESDYAGVCPRTYVGKRTQEASEDLAGMPRYSPRFWPWREGRAERTRVCRLFGREGTCRVVATRVIDLVGLPQSPHQRRMSYICFFLGSGYSRISSWLDPLGDDSIEHPKFAEILRRRVTDAELAHEEHSTLGSVSFLARRLQSAGELPDHLQCLLSLDRKVLTLDAAMAGAAVAFSRGDQSRFEKAFRDGMSTAICRQAMARKLHAAGLGKASESEAALANSELASLIFYPASYSGVHPFGF